VKPITLLGWYQQLVRLKWTYRQRNLGGRARTDGEIERLVVRLARENNWEIERIEGEVKKLGYTINHETVGNMLRRHGIPRHPCARHHPVGDI
jgi:transposase